MEWKKKKTNNNNNDFVAEERDNCIAIVHYDDDDDDEKKTKTNEEYDNDKRTFVLHLDGRNASMIQQQQQLLTRQKQQSTKETSSSHNQKQDYSFISDGSDKDEPSIGLRRRRQRGHGEELRGHDSTTSATATTVDTTNQWTAETFTLHNQKVDHEDDEQQHTQQKRNNNPLTLFGVPPPALRVAQSKSRVALAYYVEVANLAREIMHIISHHQEGVSRMDEGGMNEK